MHRKGGGRGHAWHTGALAPCPAACGDALHEATAATGGVVMYMLEGQGSASRAQCTCVREREGGGLRVWERDKGQGVTRQQQQLGGVEEALPPNNFLPAEGAALQAAAAAPAHVGVAARDQRHLHGALKADAAGRVRMRQARPVIALLCIRACIRA